jgi:hypothetical protein
MSSDDDDATRHFAIVESPNHSNSNLVTLSSFLKYGNEMTQCPEKFAYTVKVTDVHFFTENRPIVGKLKRVMGIYVLQPEKHHFWH